MEYDKIHIVASQSLKDLRAHEKPWNDLLNKCPDASPMQSYAWTYSYCKYAIKDTMNWICLFAYEGNKLVSAYPLIYSNKKGIPGFYFQVFKSPYDMFHTVRVDGLILEGYKEVLVLFFNHIYSKFNVYPVIKIISNPDYSTSFRCFKQGNKKLTFLRIENGIEEVISLKKGLENYLSELSPKFKREIKRRKRRLHENFQIRYLSSWGENHKSNKEYFAEFLDIENSGWKGKKGTSLKKLPKASEFLSNLTQNLANNGWLLWNLLEADKKVIAIQLYLILNKTAYLLKVAYREEYSSYAPGHLLFFKFIENCHSKSNIKYINLLSKRSWHKSWEPREYKLYNIMIMPKKGLYGPLIKIIYQTKKLLF